MTFSGVLLVPLGSDLAVSEGWRPGPLPLDLPFGGTTDAATRSTYFDRRAATVLYGEREGTQRWHRDGVGLLADEFRVTALEWLTAPELGDDVRGVAIVHLEAIVDDLAAVHRAWGACLRWKAGGEGRRVVRDVLEGEVGMPVATPDAVRPFGVAFVDGIPPGAPPPFPRSGLPVDDQWLFGLAAGVAEPTYGLSATEVATHPDLRLGLSADWSALVLRDGAAFVGHADADVAREAEVPSAAPDQFLQTAAPTYVRTIYADAFLLGLLQTTALRALTDALAAVEDPARSPRDVEQLDARFSRFRNTLWWQHLTQHGHGNELLRRLHEQRRLPELVEQTTAELEDYSRQTTLRLGRNLNVLVALFALVGAVGVAIEAFALYRGPEARPGTGATIVAVLLLVLLGLVVVAYPLGRLSRRNWRRR